MITGTVNARFEMVIKVPVRTSAGHEQEVEAILDSGFTGSLTLPPSLIAGIIRNLARDGRPAASHQSSL